MKLRRRDNNKISIKIFDINGNFKGHIQVSKNIISSEVWGRKISTKRKKMFLKLIKIEVEKLLKITISCLWIYKDKQEIVVEIFTLNHHKRIVITHIGRISHV